MNRNITNEVYDFAIGEKLYPIPYFPQYLLSKTGKIFDIELLKYIKPIKTSKKKCDIYYLKNYQGEYERRSIERLICDICYGRSEFPINNSIDIHIIDASGIQLTSKNSQVIIINDIDISIDNIIFKRIENTTYYISNNGICYNLKTNKFIKANIRNGYYNLSVLKKYISQSERLHRIVYTVWVGPIPDGLEIDHKNGYKWDNYYKNLSAISSIENIYRATLQKYMNINESVEEFIMRIVNEIMSGKPYKDIAELLHVPLSLIKKIGCKDGYYTFTKEYDFFHTRGRITRDEANLVHLLLKDGKTNQQIADTTGFQINIIKSIRAGSSHCYLDKNDYPLTGHAILSMDDAKHIRYLIDEYGYTDAELGRKYNVSRKTISNIRLLRTYKDGAVTRTQRQSAAKLRKEEGSTTIESIA